MVFWVIVCIDSYLYTQKKNAHAPIWGVGVKQKTRSKNGTRFNRDPCMTFSMTQIQRVKST
jgi:hypothetical protein